MKKQFQSRIAAKSRPVGGAGKGHRGGEPTELGQKQCKECIGLFGFFDERAGQCSV